MQVPNCQGHADGTARGRLGSALHAEAAAPTGVVALPAIPALRVLRFPVSLFPAFLIAVISASNHKREISLGFCPDSLSSLTNQTFVMICVETLPPS